MIPTNPKNIVDQSQSYQKHNSFDNFRLKSESSFEDLKLRLKPLSGRISGTENFKSIVQKAIDDVLTPVSHGSAVFKLDPHSIAEMSHIQDSEIPRYLFYRYRYEIFPQQHQVDDFPPCIQLEVASICNFRCVFCYQTDAELTSKQNGHMGTMSYELFQKVIDQAAGKCEAITLASRGEPLVCRDIIKMLHYMSGKFLASKMNTNASLLTEEKCHGILQSGLSTLVYSADAAEEPMYSQLRVGGSLEKTLSNVKMFSDIRRKHYPQSKLITRVSGVKVNDTQNMDAMDKIWGEFVDEVAFVNYNPWENTYERPLNTESRPCSDLWRRMFVWWDGRVNPCDVDYKSMLCVGQFPEKPLSEVWTKGLYADLRQHHLQNRRHNVHPCNRCTLI